MKTPRHWSYNSDDTALVLVDPQNDYLSHGGGLHELLASQIESFRVIENLKRLLAAARLRKLPVYFTRLGFDEGDYEVHAIHELSGFNRLLFDRKLFLRGNWGAEFHPELRPLDGHEELSEHKKFNIFFSSLPDLLHKRAIEKLIVAGIGADTAIACSANAATERGFDVTVVKDAIISFTDASYAQALQWSLPFISNLLLFSNELEHLMFDEPAAQVSELIGANVFSNDGGWLGRVITIHETHGPDDFALEIGSVHPFARPIFVPAQVIAKASRQRIYLNIPGKLVDMAAEGWREAVAVMDKQMEKKKAEAA